MQYAGVGKNRKVELTEREIPVPEDVRVLICVAYSKIFGNIFLVCVIGAAQYLM